MRSRQYGATLTTKISQIYCANVLQSTENDTNADSAGPIQVNWEMKNPLGPLGFFDIHPKNSEVC